MNAKYLYQFFLKAIENGYSVEEIDIEAHYEIIYIHINSMEVQRVEGWMPADIFKCEDIDSLAMFT